MTISKFFSRSQLFRKKFLVPFLITFILLSSTSCQQGYKGNYSTTYYEALEESTPVADSDAPTNFNTEEYDRIYENAFLDPVQNPLSTFSIDVDNASYSNIRRFLEDNMMPPKDAVRIEEMINYFDYSYEQPSDNHPFSITTEQTTCPWNPDNKLLLIGLQGKSPDFDHFQPSNLVFLIDVSGSMRASNKLPLVKNSLRILLDQLSAEDRVAIVVYAGAAGLVLPSTSAGEKDVILKAIKKLQSGGSTAGGAGIELAYKVAKENYIHGGNNRVILSTDGDFNVGSSSTGDMVRLIEEKRKEDIYLTICGYGMGNYKDGRMEQISNAGNGNYFYIDNVNEAEKVFKKDIRANLFTIAKDVKIQVEFNPNMVEKYRLIGYENRVMNTEEFDDDLKDAGELGAGHSVTALYEIIPNISEKKSQASDHLQYQDIKVGENRSELATIKLRYKPTNSDQSILLSRTVDDFSTSYQESSSNMKLSAVVAGFGMLLRDSQYKASLTFPRLLDMSSELSEGDQYKQELRSMIKTASLIETNM